MEILNIIKIVVEILMFAGVFTTSIYLVVYLRKFNAGLNDINAKIENISTEIKPVLSDISILSEKFKSISEKAIRISDNAENITGRILLKTEEAELYVDEIRDTVLAKIRNIINMIHALNSGFRTFYKKIN